MNTIRRLFAALATLAVATIAIVAATGGSGTPSAYWVCVYVDHVHVTICQDKPVDLFPDNAVGGAVGDVARDL